MLGLIPLGHCGLRGKGGQIDCPVMSEADRNADLWTLHGLTVVLTPEEQELFLFGNHILQLHLPLGCDTWIPAYPL